MLIFSILMEDSFVPTEVKGEAAMIFDHRAAHDREKASVFWANRRGALGGEQSALEDWQYKRGNTRRGIVEVVSRD